MVAVLTSVVPVELAELIYDFLEGKRDGGEHHSTKIPPVVMINRGHHPRPVLDGIK